MIRPGGSSAQAIIRARIQFKIDEGCTAAGWPPPWTTRSGRKSAPSGGTPRGTGCDAADSVLHRRNHVNRYRKLDDRAEAYRVALDCTPPGNWSFTTPPSTGVCSIPSRACRRDVGDRVQGAGPGLPQGRKPSREGAAEVYQRLRRGANAAAAAISWRFTAKEAKARLRRLYSDTSDLTRP